MSFYGTTYNQISDAFASFYVSNSGKNNNNFLNSEDLTSNLRIRADGRDGEIYLDSGNKWIQMRGNFTDNYCKIYHGPADSENLTIKNMIKLSTIDEIEEEPIIIDLSEDVFLKTRILKYDKTGHISNISSQYFKIPELNIFSQICTNNTDGKNFLSSSSPQTINSDGLSDTFNIGAGNKWISIEGNDSNNTCKIYHGKANIDNISNLIPFEKITDPDRQAYIDELEDLVVLDLANNVYLQANEVKYDEAGHAYRTTPKYFKIPLVKTSEILKGFEEEIEAFKKNVTTTIDGFNTDLISAKEDLDKAEITISNHDSSINNIIEINDTQNDSIDNLELLCGSKNDLSSIEEVTICSTIGNIDYLRNNGKNEEDVVILTSDFNELNLKTNPTLCDFLNATKNEVVRYGSTSALAINLDARLRLIEEKLGI